MEIEYSKKFIKEFKKCQPKVKSAFYKRLELFIKDKYHPLLHNHSLSGRLKDYRSINVDGDYRVLFQEFNNGQTVYFVVIGSHSQLYS
ncbi:MAG TPA: type II toxin-antitoxin system mRNA interferase toxin, RelE/StbE family [Patescibacteria group bacterium]|nr:type II toxin-antitoxin system mRNA interferase toxin, RelE/StbE family [Patescibacteria group bacterium]